jgi:hypothetical protein
MIQINTFYHKLPQKVKKKKNLKFFLNNLIIKFKYSLATTYIPCTGSFNECYWFSIDKIFIEVI